MPRLTRRNFLKGSALTGIGSALAVETSSSAPLALTARRTGPSTLKGELIFRSILAGESQVPHAFAGSYATDPEWDAFYSNIAADDEGVRVSDTGGRERFGINVRWLVEPFGYLFLTADRAGEFYQLPAAGESRALNLAFELAESRAARNRKRVEAFRRQGWKPSHETRAFIDLSQEYLADARKSSGMSSRCAELSQKSLLYALQASEKMEVGYARDMIRGGWAL
jgi:hypothetical protein